MKPITIKRPTLIIHEVRAKANIQWMVSKAKRLGLHFRPHFKTHQSATVGQWFRDAGVERIAVSSVSMAAYFQAHGWQDITIAFPYNPLEWEEIDQLSENGRLTVTIESAWALADLKLKIKHPIRFVIKVDVGYGRTGIKSSDAALIRNLADSATEKCQFAGLLAHAGHTYEAVGKEAIEKIHRASIQSLNQLSATFLNKPFISYGDTPACSVSEYFEDVSELRCGNFIYYDLTQAKIGSCREDQIAVVLACPIVAQHFDRREVVIYGGAIHLSKDFIEEGGKYYGKIVAFKGLEWQIMEGVFLKKISQEHGIIQLPEEYDQLVFQIGAILGVLPVHACLAVDSMTAQQTLGGVKIEKMTKI